VISAISTSACARISFFLGGISASHTATVIAAFDQNLKPSALILSRTSDVVVVP
jgi:hypothetical protein